MKLEELIDPLFEIEETIGEDEFTQALAVKKAMEAEIKEKVKTVQEIYSAVAKARAILPNIQQELIFSTIDEVGTLIGLDQSEGLQEIFFKRMSLEIYQKSIDNKTIYDSLKIDESYRDNYKMSVLVSKSRCFQHFLSLDIDAIGLLSIQNNYGQTPVHVGLCANSVETLPMLLRLDNAAEILSIKDKFDQAVLYVALGQYPEESLPAVLESDNAAETLSIRDMFGCTLLHFALAKEPVEMQAILLQSDKVTIEALSVRNNDGNTPLYFALQENPEKILPVLLQSGKVTIEALSVQNNDGNTPLHSALAKNPEEILPVLLKEDNVRNLLMIKDSRDNSLFDVIVKNYSENLDQLIGLVNDGKLELKDFNKRSCHYVLFTSGEWIFQLRVLADIIVRFWDSCCSYLKLPTTVPVKDPVTLSTDIGSSLDGVVSQGNKIEASSIDSSVTINSVE